MDNLDTDLKVMHEPGYRVQKYMTQECRESNCYECKDDRCGCYHHDSSAFYSPKPEHGYDPTPNAGTKGRKAWIARNRPPFSEGGYHLHAIYNRGEVVWVLRTRSNALCKSGRCLRVYVQEQKF